MKDSVTRDHKGHSSLADAMVAEADFKEQAGPAKPQHKDEIHTRPSSINERMEKS